MEMSQLELDDLLEGDLDDAELEPRPSIRHTAPFVRVNNVHQMSPIASSLDTLHLRDDDGILF